MNRWVGVWWIASLAVILGQAGCSTTASSPPLANKPTLPADAQPAVATGLTAAQLGEARQLCLTKCARCHPIYHPAAYAEDEWQVWMAKMSRKARLKPPQTELIARYLEGFRPAK